MGSPDRIFSILEAVVSQQAAGLTFAEVVARTGLPKSSVHRILKDLTGLGYLTLNLESRRYQGGLKLGSLGASVMSNLDLRVHVHPHLLKLHRETDHTCHMGIKSGGVGVYLDKLESRDYSIRLFSEIGKTFPLHCTGVGKVLLSFSPAKEVREILSVPLEAYTQNTITDPEALRRELEEIRLNGYAVDREEITRGIMCVAAPVFGGDDSIVCAISVTFPTYIYSDRGLKPEKNAVIEQARVISNLMKYSK